MKHKELDSLKPLSYLDNIKEKENNYVHYLVKNIKSNKTIKNIGIIGPYGSGKSSITHSAISVLDKRNKHTIYFSKETLSSHIDIKELDASKKEDIKISIYEELLNISQISTFQNFLSSLNSNKLRLLKVIFLLISALSLGFVLFSILYFVLGILLWVSIPISVAITTLLGYLFLNFKINQTDISISTKFITTRFIGVNKEDRLVNLEDDIKDNPVFYENIICKLFKRLHIKYFVIEDIERLFNYNEIDYEKIQHILEEFKILNELVNRSKIVKSRVIFFYGLNDSCFKDAEAKTKFFDLIVPITPISTYSSASKAITDYIDVDHYEMDKEMINVLSFYFGDQRKINALLTHFFLTMKENKNHKNSNKLFAISTFSTLFPYQFSLLTGKNNYLDKIFDGIYKFDNNSIRSTKDPNDQLLIKLNKGDFYYFLKTCIENHYIEKDYKSYLSIMMISDNKVLTDKDFLTLRSAYAHEDIRFNKIDNAKIILVRDEYKSLLKTIHQLNPALVDTALFLGDPSYINNLNQALTQTTGDNCNDVCDTIYHLFISCNYSSLIEIVKIVSNTAQGYDAFQKIQDTKIKAKLTSLFIDSFNPTFYQNNNVLMKPLFDVLNSEEFSCGELYTISNSSIKKLSACPDFKLFNVNRFKDYFDIIKDKKCYKVSIENISVLYPDIFENPYKTILNNQRLNEYLTKSGNLINIISKIPYNEDFNSYLFQYLATLNNTELQTKILSSDAFLMHKYKIKYNNSNFQYTNINLLMLNLGLLDINSAYDYIPNETLKYIDNNLESLLNNNFTLNNKIAVKLLTSKTNIGGYLKMINEVKLTDQNILSLTVPLSKDLFSILDEESKNKIVQFTIKNKKDVYIQCLSQGFIDLKYLSNHTLTQEEVKTIYDSDLSIYYPLLLQATNIKIIDDFLTRKPNNSAKLIFTSEGKIYKDSNLPNIVNICVYEYDSNPGCTIEVIKNIGDMKFKNEDWYPLICKLSNKQNVTQGDVLTISSNNTNQEIILLLESINVIKSIKDKRLKRKISFKVL